MNGVVGEHTCGETRRWRSSASGSSSSGPTSLPDPFCPRRRRRSDPGRRSLYRGPLDGTAALARRLSAVPPRHAGEGGRRLVLRFLLQDEASLERCGRAWPSWRPLKGLPRNEQVVAACTDAAVRVADVPVGEPHRMSLRVFLLELGRIGDVQDHLSRRYFMRVPPPTRLSPPETTWSRDRCPSSSSADPPLRRDAGQDERWGATRSTG